jgi:thiamine transport system substrate-binding protein
VLNQHKVRVLGAFVVVVVAGAITAGCGGADSGDATKEGAATTAAADTAASTPTGGSKDVVLVTHDSFVIPKPVKAAFERQTGLKLRILQGGDAGEMLNRALLTKGNPQGDVIFGVDNNLLSRAVGAGLLEPYVAKGIGRVDAAYRQLDATHELTPVDHADVCLNVDRRWFSSHRLAPPASLGDLTKPAYRGLLVVENPATSTPGLAFMLATIARYGASGWQSYWKQLRANGVLVVDGWEEAYTAQFSGAGGSKGTRPIVVSYATSPPAEVIYAKTKPTTAPTASVAASCFRQVELAGVLKGARNLAGARALVDFMLSEQFQAAMPESMFVLPVRNGTPLPDAFRRYAVSPVHPLELPAAEIGRNRDRWIDEWTRVTLH